MIESVTPTGNACVQMMMEEAGGMRVEWVLKVKLLVPWEFGWVCGDAVLCCATGYAVGFVTGFQGPVSRIKKRLLPQNIDLTHKSFQSFFNS